MKIMLSKKKDEANLEALRMADHWRFIEYYLSVSINDFIAVSADVIVTAEE